MTKQKISPTQSKLKYLKKNSCASNQKLMAVFITIRTNTKFVDIDHFDIS